MIEFCIYCDKDYNLLFSEEIDAHLHIECLKKQLLKNPKDPELRCLKQEFGIQIDESK